MDFTKEYQKYQQEIVYHVKKLVSINSVLKENEEVDGVVYPFGYGNYKALDYVLKLAKSFGFTTHNVDGVCGHVEYGEGEELFAVLCHVDVVPAIGEWKRDPFECYEENGLLYGRGTSDDKGPAIATLYALKMIKDLNIKLKKRIRLIFGTDEETGSRGLKRYLEVSENPKYGISPDADFPLIYGEKGILSFDVVGDNNTSLKVIGGARYNIVAPSLKFKLDNYKNKSKLLKDSDGFYLVNGKSAHAMEPDNGINAIKEFVKIINKDTDNNLIQFINDFLMNSRLKDMGLNVTDEQMGDLTMNLGLLNIDNESRLGINIRYPKNLDYEYFINTFTKKASSYGLKVIVKSNSEPHYVNPNSKFIKTLYKSYVKYTNDYTPVKTIGGGTYARDLKCGVAMGFLFPDEIEMAHETNEYIKVESMMKAGVIIADVIYSIGKNKSF